MWVGYASFREVIFHKMKEPHIVIVLARGEAIRNFLYSDTLRVLSENAKVTLLSAIEDDKFLQRLSPLVHRIILLRYYAESRVLNYLRDVLLHAHFRWLWSEKAKNKWEILRHRAVSPASRIKFELWRGLLRALANRPVLETLTWVDRYLSHILRPTHAFHRLFAEIKPDIVFNCSHIHGPLGDLPMRVAHQMGIRTTAFIFSWDNLTTRSRILVPYDYYLVWHRSMQEELLTIYPSIKPEQVFVTGTPQFDFHFRPELWLSKEELCARIGADPNRPIVLYTTGMASDFPEEYQHVEMVIETLQELDISPKPQLVVRTYVKGTSPEMMALAQRSIADVIFPPVLWEERWFTPKYEDLAIYTNLLRHANLGINAASTVSLELMMHDKPVINIGYDPPGSQLPRCYRWVRHIEYEHYRPVAESGAVMLARSYKDMRAMIQRGLTEPDADREKRRSFIQGRFDCQLDGKAGQRVAETLVALAKGKRSL